MGSHRQRLNSRRQRVIYNDDFRTVISANQPKSGFPSAGEDLEGLVERVGGTGVTTYTNGCCCL